MKKVSIKIVAFVLVMIVMTFLLTGCAGLGDDNKFKIVTSFYPIYITTLNITEGAKDVKVTNMMDTNTGCIHDYTLATKDLKNLEKANVFIINGLGLESNILNKVNETYPEMKIINATRQFSRNNFLTESGEENGHVWTSIEKYIIQVEEITEKLVELNEANKEVYQKNKSEYIGKLRQLQKEYQEQLKDKKGQTVLVLNESLTHFAENAGFKVITVSSDHEESTLSAEQLKTVIEQVKQQGIKAILVDEGDNLQNANTISTETGAKIYTLNSATNGNKEKDAYLNIMRNNLEILKGINF